MKNVINARFEPEQLKRFNEFKELHGLTSSQALRILVEIGLTNGERIDVAWAKAAHANGVFQGVKMVREAVTMYTNVKK